MKPLSSRMPLMLSVQESLLWLAADTAVDQLRTMLVPRLRGDMTAVPIDPEINNSRNKLDTVVQVAGKATIISC